MTKVSVTITGLRNVPNNNGIERKDMWGEVQRFFVKEKKKTEHMNLLKFNAENKFGLLINLRSMAGQAMHGKATRLVNTTDGIQLEIERKVEGYVMPCHVFVISDSQFKILDRQLEYVQYLIWTPATRSSWGLPIRGRRSSS